MPRIFRVLQGRDDDEEEDARRATAARKKRARASHEGSPTFALAARPACVPLRSSSPLAGADDRALLRRVRIVMLEHDFFEFSLCVFLNFGLIRKEKILVVGIVTTGTDGGHYT